MPSLSLNRTALNTFARYAKATGKNVSAVIDQAVEYWFENHDEIILEELTKPDGPKLVKRKA